MFHIFQVMYPHSWEVFVLHNILHSCDSFYMARCVLKNAQFVLSRDGHMTWSWCSRFCRFCLWGTLLQNWYFCIQELSIRKWKKIEPVPSHKYNPIASNKVFERYDAIGTFSLVGENVTSYFLQRRSNEPFRGINS